MMIKIKFNNDVTISKSKDEWIDDLVEYHLNLAYDDGEFCNGLLDDFLRDGFQGYYHMTDNQIIAEVSNHLNYLYE